jgi:16S rRNA (cytidine1402-2'-O)-methyltransferase
MRTTIKGAIDYYEQNSPRGEYVLIIDGCKDVKNSDDDIFSDMTVEQQVQFYIDNQNMSKMDAIKATAKQRGVGKSEIYKLVTK